MGRPPSGRRVTRWSGRTSWPSRKVEPRRADDAGQDDHGFLEGERGADADARAGAEGQVGEAVDGAAPLRHETVGIEGVRLVPKPPMPVQHPGRDRHHGAFRDLEVADAVVANGARGS